MAAQPRPAAVTWFLVYCGVSVCACYLVTGRVSADSSCSALEPAQLDMTSMEATVTGVLLTVVGGTFLAASAAPFFLPARPWVWIYADLVVTACGMTRRVLYHASIPAADLLRCKP